VARSSTWLRRVSLSNREARSGFEVPQTSNPRPSCPGERIGTPPKGSGRRVGRGNHEKSWLGACPTLGSTKISTHTFGLGSTILTRSICFHPPKSVIFGNVGQAPREPKPGYPTHDFLIPARFVNWSGPRHDRRSVSWLEMIGPAGHTLPGRAERVGRHDGGLLRRPRLLVSHRLILGPPHRKGRRRHASRCDSRSKVAKPAAAKTYRVWLIQQL